MLKEISISKPVEKFAAPVVLKVSHLSKSFGSNTVLTDFSITLKKGESVIVLGKSGSGKSVLIKCIIGLLQPDEGYIEVFGKAIADLDQEGLDQVRAKVGFLFQSNALYDSMTVRQNLEFPLRRHWIQLSPGDAATMVSEALEDVGLAHTVNMMPAELSGGMRKRIALARTLIMKPEIILYDEPTTGLDPVTAKEIIELIITIQKKYKSTSLIITHDMTCVKLASDRVAMLIDGRCFKEGTFDELSRSTDKQISQFFE